MFDLMCFDMETCCNMFEQKIKLVTILYIILQNVCSVQKCLLFLLN